MDTLSKPKSDKLLRIGELAKKVGKTVRAIHLYEELGLVQPATRTEGGFRLYYRDAVKRILWVIKLQAIGFKLSDIQAFVREFEGAPSGREATDQVRSVFADKHAQIRRQIEELQSIERDLGEVLSYLDACQDCPPHVMPSDCHNCARHGDDHGPVPTLFANLSRRADGAESVPEDPAAQSGYDVSVTALTDAPQNGQNRSIEHAPALNAKLR